MIKAFLFDYGGVVSKGGLGSDLTNRLAKHLDITADDAFKLLRLVWDDYARGKISEDEVWRMLETAYGGPIQLDKRAIWNTWKDNMQPQTEIIELIAELKDKGYPVGVVSNVIPNTASEIQKNGGYDIFDFVILSSEVGYSKPETEIYELALAKLPTINPQEVVFIDDQERCLIPARRLGMMTLLAESPHQIKREVSALIA